MNVLTMIRRWLTSGRLLGDVFALAGGTVIAQLFLIAAAPFLTRLFKPADFGVLAVFASTLGILGVIVSWRYEFAIPIAKNDEEAANLLVLSLSLVVLTSAGVAITVFFWGERYAQWSNAPELSSFIWLVPLGLLAFGFFQAINYWHTRKKSFAHIGIAKMLQSAGQVVFQLIAGIGSLGALGLVLGQVLGRVASAAYLVYKLSLDLHLVSVRGIRSVGVRYKKFPLFTAWASLINVIGTQAPVIMFAKLFTTEIAGLFSLTIRILSLPAALIGQAVGQALYPRLAEKAKHSSAPSRMISDAALVLLIIAFPIFVFIGAYGPLLFTLVFGPGWYQSGIYARYLSPWLLLAFISSPLSMFVFVKEQQGLAFVITIYETSIRIGSIWVGSMLNSADWAVILYASVGVLISLVYILWVFWMAQVSIYGWVIQHRYYLLSAISVLLLVSIIASNDTYISMAIGATVLSAHLWLWLHKYRGLLHA